MRYARRGLTFAAITSCAAVGATLLSATADAAPVRSVSFATAPAVLTAGAFSRPAPATPGTHRVIVTLKGRAGQHPGVATVSTPRTAAAHVRRTGGRLRRIYTSALNGYSADLTPAAIRALRRDPAVADVAVNQRMKISGTTGSWALDRLDQPRLPLNGTFRPSGGGAGVVAYVFDTGIAPGHAEFGGRAHNVADFVGGNGIDCHGHGTAVSSNVGGATLGVARNVRIESIRVLDCEGFGSTEGIVASLDWVIRHHRTVHRGRPAVVNMSLGGGVSTPLDQAVQRVVSAGIPVVVAAGNENGPACEASPARAPGAITVGATDRYDARASFSNYGSCVDVTAPGVDVDVADIRGGNTGRTTMNGTSFASPLTAGAVARILSSEPTATPARIASSLRLGAARKSVWRQRDRNGQMLFVGR